MKTVIISQARMSSTRLPGKVMRQVLGVPLIQVHIERLLLARSADAVCIATTDKEADDIIAQFCLQQKVACYRGSENDVLDRYANAARQMQAEVIVRVTADCPLIDPAIIDKVIDYYHAHAASNDYVSNVLKRTYPRGMDTEVFSKRVLFEANTQATKPAEREHVTPFIYSHPERYRLANVGNSVDESRHRWTIDTPEDFELISRIVSKFGSRRDFHMRDILELIDQHPDWTALNQQIVQKPVF